MKSEAEIQYSRYGSIILYCDKVNSTLPESEKIKKGDVNIKLDYEELILLDEKG